MITEIVWNLEMMAHQIECPKIAHLEYDSVTLVTRNLVDLSAIQFCENFWFLLCQKRVYGSHLE